MKPEKESAPDGSSPRVSNAGVRSSHAFGHRPTGVTRVISLVTRRFLLFSAVPSRLSESQDTFDDPDLRRRQADLALARHLLSRLSRQAKADPKMITLTWLPHWHAYVIRREGRILGMVRCQHPLPFRTRVHFR